VKSLAWQAKFGAKQLAWQVESSDETVCLASQIRDKSSPGKSNPWAKSLAWQAKSGAKRLAWQVKSWDETVCLAS
jgi:hypothetical protein